MNATTLKKYRELNHWGRVLWRKLHTISFNYPDNPTKKEIKEHYSFFDNLNKLLPCGACQDNFKKHLKKMPLTSTVFKNKENLSKWVYNLHNAVNKSLHKPNRLTYDDVRKIYNR